MLQPPQKLRNSSYEINQMQASDPPTPFRGTFQTEPQKGKWRGEDKNLSLLGSSGLPRLLQPFLLLLLLQTQLTASHMRPSPYTPSALPDAPSLLVQLPGSLSKGLLQNHLPWKALLNHILPQDKSLLSFQRPAKGTAGAAHSSATCSVTLDQRPHSLSLSPHVCAGDNTETGSMAVFLRRILPECPQHARLRALRQSLIRRASPRSWN